MEETILEKNGRKTGGNILALNKGHTSPGDPMCQPLDSGAISTPTPPTFFSPFKYY